MTELSYIVREDWAQVGRGMESNSQRISDWLGTDPVVFAVPDVKKFNEDDRPADVEAYNYLRAAGVTSAGTVGIQDLRRLETVDVDGRFNVVVIHPYGDEQYELVRRTFKSGLAHRINVLVWSGSDMIRYWLDAHQAVNVAGDTICNAPDPLRLTAAEMMVREQYNGLSTSRGKDAVVQLLRAFRRDGDELNEKVWLRAFFAAGGDFDEAVAVSRFLKEIKAGKQHRTRQRYKDNIVEILKGEISST